MVGGATELPPSDSEYESWFWQKQKTLVEKKKTQPLRRAHSAVVVSLDRGHIRQRQDDTV